MTHRVSVRSVMMMIAATGAFATLALGCDSNSVKAGDGGAKDGSSDGPGLTALQVRGSYLVNAVIACSDCHTPQGAMGPDLSKFLAGNSDFIKLPNGDALPTPNLTNDATGLKNYSDAEIKKMLLDGVRPLQSGTGTEALNPVMPYYVFHNMTDDDANAIVAYLRTVAPVVNSIPHRGATFDVPAPAPALDLTKLPAVADTFADKASALRGKYLATQSGVCVECHTKHLPPGSATVLDEAHLFEGGEDFSAIFAATLMIKPVSKNLTSDPATGLGMWTAADIVKVLKEGKAKDGSGICPPMPVGMAAYGNLTDKDRTDIANYIRSLPPKVNMIVDMCSFPPTVPAGDGGADGGVDASPSTDGGTGG